LPAAFSIFAAGFLKDAAEGIEHGLGAAIAHGHVIAADFSVRQTSGSDGKNSQRSHQRLQ